MFRLWGKVIKDNRLLWDYVYENDSTQLNRTRKVFDGWNASAKNTIYQFPYGLTII